MCDESSEVGIESRIECEVGVLRVFYINLYERGSESSVFLQCVYVFCFNKRLQRQWILLHHFVHDEIINLIQVLLNRVFIK